MGCEGLFHSSQEEPMKRISSLCLLLVVFFAIPICGSNSLAGKSAEPVMQADGPIPFPPLPPRAFSLA
jgi:hypothetical protein